MRKIHAEAAWEKRDVGEVTATCMVADQEGLRADGLEVGRERDPKKEVTPRGIAGCSR